MTHTFSVKINVCLTNDINTAVFMSLVKLKLIPKIAKTDSIAEMIVISTDSNVLRLNAVTGMCDIANVCKSLYIYLCNNHF